MLYFNPETCSWVPGVFFFILFCFVLSYIKLQKSNQKTAICVQKEN